MDVASVVRPLLKGIKPGTGSGEIIALCPFHDDAHPSFSISLKPGKEGLFYCQACHAAGNLAIFLRKMKVSPQRAESLVRELDAPVRRKRYKELTTSEKSFLPESVLAAFYKCPLDMVDLGFGMDLLREYDIGFDEVRDRITFPLRDVDGRLIGISGRATEFGANPRYLIYTRNEFRNFQEYEQPRKDFLWNMHRLYAQHVAGELDTLYVVEGFKVCLWMIQHGYHASIAVVGSGMTNSQEKLLGSLTGRFVLAFDNDDAGLQGMLNLGRRLRPYGRVDTVDPGVLDSMEVQQLDELGADSLHQVLEKTINFARFSLQLKRRRVTHGPKY